MGIELRKRAKILPWIYIALLYITAISIYVVFFLDSGQDEGGFSFSGNIFQIIIYILCFLLFITGIANCAAAWMNFKDKREDVASESLAVIRYVTIPAYLLWAYLLFGITVLSFVAIFSVLSGEESHDLYMKGMGFFYVEMQITKVVGLCYAFSYLLITVNDRATWKTAIHLIIQFMSVWDVIDTVVLMDKKKKRIELTRTSLAIMVLVVVIIIGFLALILYPV